MAVQPCPGLGTKQEENDWGSERHLVGLLTALRLAVSLQLPAPLLSTVLGSCCVPASSLVPSGGQR